MVSAPRGSTPPRGLETYRDVSLTCFGVIASVAALSWMLGPLLDVLLLAFSGLLLGLVLRGAASWVAQRTPLGPRIAVAGLCIAGGVSAAVAVAFMAPEVSRQIRELTEAIPRAFSQLRGQLEDLSWLEQPLERAQEPGALIEDSDAMQQAGGLLSNTLGALASALVVAFVALFVAVDPAPYRQGLLRLVPQRHRDAAGEVLGATAQALRQWMLGKLISMAVVGISTWAGLALLNVPLALVLALAAALLTFIPNFGPVLSALPAILLALVHGPAQAAYVAALYVGVQTLESYVLTPLVQEKTIALPPALTIVAQVLMGTLAGAVGLFVATPLTAALVMLVRHLYVGAILGDREGLPSSGEPDAESAKRAGVAE
jgi:predicted PurR-regulated permease PerM